MTNPNKIKKLIYTITGTIFILFVFFFVPVKSYLTSILLWSNTLGFFEQSIIFILTHIICTVFFLPGVVLTIFSGYIHGIFIGVLLSCIGGTLGSLVAFYLGRLVISSKVKHWATKVPLLSGITSAINHTDEGWKIAFLLRLSPLTPYPLLNYLLSITCIKTYVYTITTFVGMIPGTIMYAYLGKTAESVKNAVSSDTELVVDSMTQLWIGLIGIIGTILVVFLISVIVQRTLKRIVDAPLLPT